MTLLILSGLLACACGVWVIQPILSRRAALLADVEAGALLDAESRRRVALASLQELEYEFLAGKLDDADYAQVRAQLSREAVQAVRAAKAARGVQDAPSTPAAESAACGCGFPNPAGSRFCGGCGERLG